MQGLKTLLNRVDLGIRKTLGGRSLSGDDGPHIPVISGIGPVRREDEGHADEGPITLVAPVGGGDDAGTEGHHLNRPCRYAAHQTCRAHDMIPVPEGDAPGGCWCADARGRQCRGQYNFLSRNRGDRRGDQPEVACADGDAHHLDHARRRLINPIARLIRRDFAIA